jgi:DNA-binding winged helix-turn-helix (wHTH) protein
MIDRLETGSQIGGHVLVVGQSASLTNKLVEFLRADRILVSGTDSWSAMEDTLRRIKMDLVTVPSDLLQTNVGSIKYSNLARTKSRVALVANKDVSHSETFDWYLDVVGRIRSRSGAVAMAADISALLRSMRIKDVQRRSGCLRFGDWVLDPLSRSYSRSDGCVVYLDNDEFELLQLLCEHSGTVVSRSKIVRTLYRGDSRCLRGRLNRVASSLRSKVENGAGLPEQIKAVGDFGFVLSAETGFDAVAPRETPPARSGCEY